jgi:hypothetical protein
MFSIMRAPTWNILSNITRKYLNIYPNSKSLSTENKLSLSSDAPSFIIISMSYAIEARVVGNLDRNYRNKNLCIFSA